ncbi:LarC family nickel insertion protein [Eubacterium sp. AB3007]|uniref:LarC family nickel insertion protein n=1 Tax=Eubacterium sp. AB3007 TaxID=1392487 RepID=UPI00068EFF77|nr:LarC family nickel insertion protein [Eubacterium sp. AB3007]MBQ1472103.1 LarC family nickel insertion protein [Eubacterium sp.]
MSRVLYLDCDSGMSGDIFLSTMVDLGVPGDYLRDRLSLLDLDGYHLRFGTVERQGIPAASVDVVLADREAEKTDPYSGNYRNYGQIRRMIDDSALCEEEKAIAHRIFRIKSGAESVVHGVPLDEVKFHEAGAVDSVVDIVGAAICLVHLKPAKVVSTFPPTGYGQVHCACGTLNVPVPAVREIIHQTGLPHYRSDIPQEVLTPTGASILAGIVDEFVDSVPEDARNGRRGHGTGTRETGLPPMEAILS